MTPPRARRVGPAVLEVSHLSKTYRPRDRHTVAVSANSDLSLTVHAGEIVALLGPNGAGKSTFLKQVAGQLLPTSGSIRIAGIDMVADPRAAKAVLSAIPQETQPIDNLTVEEHVRYFGLLKGMGRPGARAETAAILHAVGLADLSGKLVRELSGGMKRRVLIAVAMAGASPRLMLLDEPTTGLDPAARRSVWAVLDGLRARGLALLLTTHYIEEAEELADHVAIISGGRFIVEGRVEEIRQRLPFRGKLDVSGLEHASTEALAALSGLEQRWRLALRNGHRWRFEVPDPYAADAIVALRTLNELGLHAILSLASLEDAYLAAVGEEGVGA